MWFLFRRTSQLFCGIKPIYLKHVSHNRTGSMYIRTKCDLLYLKLQLNLWQRLARHWEGLRSRKIFIKLNILLVVYIIPLEIFPRKIFFFLFCDFENGYKDCEDNVNFILYVTFSPCVNISIIFYLCGLVYYQDIFGFDFIKQCWYLTILNDLQIHQAFTLQNFECFSVPLICFLI